MSIHSAHFSGPRRAAGQRGVVLLFSLIALVIMLIASVALVRSFNASLFSSGNIAFKRDMRFQSERAADAVLTSLKLSGTLDTAIKRAADVPASNYRASAFEPYKMSLPNNPVGVSATGIPNVLALGSAAFATAGFTAADLTSSDNSVKIRYVIDRLCSTTGLESLPANSCVLADDATQAGASVLNQKGPERALGGGASAVPKSVVYRLSIMVTGPRSTQSFFQSTFAVPS